MTSTSHHPGMLKEHGIPHPVAFALAFFAQLGTMILTHPLREKTNYGPLIYFARILLLWWGVSPEDVDQGWELFRQVAQELDEEEFNKILNVYYDAVMAWVRADSERAALWYVHTVALAVLQHQQFAFFLGDELPAEVHRYLNHLLLKFPALYVVDPERSDSLLYWGFILGITASLLHGGGVS